MRFGRTRDPVEALAPVRDIPASAATGCEWESQSSSRRRFFSAVARGPSVPANGRTPPWLRSAALTSSSRARAGERFGAPRGVGVGVENDLDPAERLDHADLPVMPGAPTVVNAVRPNEGASA